MNNSRPRHVEMKIATYEGRSSYKSLKPMTLTTEQEEAIRLIWDEATTKIKEIIKSRGNG